MSLLVHDHKPIAVHKTCHQDWGGSKDWGEIWKDYYFRRAYSYYDTSFQSIQQCG